MRRPPKLTEFYRYPVIAGTALIAAAVTLAWWAKLIDASPLFETAMIRRGELWRLVTSIFPHLGLLHLIFNIYWLWVFGTLIEQVYGHLKTAGLVLLFAVGPNALEFAFTTGGAGLSGVGYGLFGLLWVLSKRDERFRDAIDQGTIQLFVVWFFICIATTVTNIMPVGNIAHGVGCALGILTGFAITLPEHRTRIAVSITAVLAFGLWAATFGRPLVNMSGTAGYEEGKWGYDALMANHNQEAVRWLRDAAKYQPKENVYWYDLGIAYERLGNQAAAMAAYQKAANHNDADGQYYLGEMYENGYGGLPKDGAQAASWYRKAADHGDAAMQNNVAWSLATSPDPAIRNPVAALEYARKAVTAEKDHPDPNHLDTLAEACYVNQQYGEAVKTEQQALSLASPELVPPENKSEFEKRLEKYQLALQTNKRPLTAK